MNFVLKMMNLQVNQVEIRFIPVESAGGKTMTTKWNGNSAELEGMRYCCELQYKCQVFPDFSIENAEIIWNCP